MSEKDGGPAFPGDVWETGYEEGSMGEEGYEEGSMGEETTYRSPVPGMTLRQWYAGLAMQGMMAREFLLSFEEVKEKAFALADEMLELEEEKKEGIGYTYEGKS